MEHGTAVSSSPREPRSEVEWHSVLQTKSRDEKLDPGHLLSQLPVKESRRADPAVRGTRIGRPDRDIAIRVIAFSSSYFFFIRVKGGGASGNAWRRHPSRLCFMANEDNGSVHGQNVPLGTSVDTPNKLIQNTSIILEVAGCLESQVERTGGSVRGIS